MPHNLLIVSGSDAVSKHAKTIAESVAALESFKTAFPGGVNHTNAPLDKRSFVTSVAEAKTIVLVQDAAIKQETGAPCWYHHRFVWVDGISTVEEATHDIEQAFTDAAPTQFVSTRGNGSDNSTFLSVVREGLSPDGGLYLPVKLPHIPKSLQYHLAHNESSYHNTCLALFERFADKKEVPPGVLQDMIANAYAKERWSGRDDVCPVTVLDEDKKTFILELYHGPTAAFKDFALQLFPHMFSLSTLGDGNDYMILAATSGDTGVAAISGFMNASPQTRVMVLYPQHGVSPVQKVQMISLDGDSIRVVGVESDFDFCQTTVKHTFNDGSIAQRLKAEHQLVLSSANSINWGRLTPQIVYYFHAYGELVRNKTLQYGETFDVAVPTGNFGNILSCYVGMLMGLPVRKFILASNQNDVLFEFVTTGKYDIRDKKLVPSISPSIDILKASNIERFIYLVSGGNAKLVADCMDKLNKEKFFELPAEYFKIIKEKFWAKNCDEETCHKTIGETFKASGDKKRIIDPHTAVAVHVVGLYEKDYLEAEKVERRPIVIASTAHWAKFPEPVLQALKGEHQSNPAAAEDAENSLDYVQKTFAAVKAEAGGDDTVAQVAPPLAAAMAKAAAGEAVARQCAADEKEIQTKMFEFVAGSA